MKKLVVANWKMNPYSTEEAGAIFNGIKGIIGEMSKIEVVICPPSIYLDALSRQGGLNKIRLGAQDASPFENVGPHTGEVSVQMLKKSEAEYVIVGHSERRAMGETDTIVNKKVIAALSSGIKPILCIGEEVRDAGGEFFNFVKRQIDDCLKNVDKTLLKNLVMAYEPVWAISGGKDSSADNPEATFEMAEFIKKCLAEHAGEVYSGKIPIIYGGSVSSKNAGDFLSKGGVSGLLVGKNSLDPVEFGKILEAAEKSNV